MKDSVLFSEIIYRFSIMFMEHMSKHDENVAKLQDSIPLDEVLERYAIPPIASVFILNECIRYLENNKEYPSESQLNEITETCYRNFNDYTNIFITSQSTLKSSVIN